MQTILGRVSRKTSASARRLGGLAGPDLDAAVRRRLAVRQVDDADLESLGLRPEQRPSHADLGVVRMRRDDKQIELSLCCVHAAEHYHTPRRRASKLQRAAGFTPAVCEFRCQSHTAGINPEARWLAGTRA
jgi:hypothetical protein